MMKLRNIAGTDAERIRSGERVVIKRWLAKHGGIDFGGIIRQDMNYLEAEVRKRGGDPEALRLKGRKMVVDAICKERGL